MRTTTLVLTILMAVPAIALLPTATADEEYYYGCQTSGSDGYFCRGVTTKEDGTGICYTEWTGSRSDGNPYGPDDTITFQQCVG